MEKLRYRKNKHGVHYHRKKAYREGDIIEVFRGELSDDILSRFTLIEPEKKRREQQVPAIPKLDEGVQLEIKQRVPGWFDVINVETGEAINDHALRKAVAEAMVKGITEKE